MVNRNNLRHFNGSAMTLKKITGLFCLFLSVISVTAQSYYFPPKTGNHWETIEPSTLGWCTEKIDPLYDYLESIHSKAFIVLKDGKIVLEKYFGTFTQDSLWYWASAGKSLTSFLVGLAQQEGYLSIQDTTSHYLGTGWTSCSQEQEDKISIWNQLTMTSGFDDGVPDNYCTLPSCLICLADPGTRWAYHNAPYTLLDGVIAAATAQPLNQYLYQKLTLPTGLSGLFVPSGYNNVFFSKPRSMARFGLLMLNHGVWEGDSIMTDTSYFRQMITTSQQLNLSYGYLWWLNGKESFMVPGLQYVFMGSWALNAPDDMYAALGKNGQFLNVVPSQNLVLVRMGNAPGDGDVPFLYNDTIWQKLNEVMCSATIVRRNPDNNGLPAIIPNPASDKFKVEWTGHLFDYSVIDNTGRIVLSNVNCREKDEINTDHLPVGIYHILMTDRAKMTEFRKIIIYR